MYRRVREDDVRQTVIFFHVMIPAKTCESARARPTDSSRNAFIVRNAHTHMHARMYASPDRAESAFPIDSYAAVRNSLRTRYLFPSSKRRM